MPSGKYEGLILQARQPVAPDECVRLARGQRFTPNVSAISRWSYAIDTVHDGFSNTHGKPLKAWAAELGGVRTPFIVPHFDSFRDFLRTEYGLEGGKQRAAVTQGRRDLWRWAVRDQQEEFGNRDQYVPDYVYAHWGEHRAKQDAYIKQCRAVSKSGATITLDPESIRRARTAYIAARMDGLPFETEGSYHAMLTLTLPPEFHRTTQWDSENNCKLSAPRKNKSWNGMQPFEDMDELRERWARARALWAKAGIKKGKIRGCRFVEPHTDGTPHMHCIVSVQSLTALDDVVRAVATAWFGTGEVTVERHERSGKHGVQWQYQFVGSRAYSGTRAMLRNLVKVDVMQDAAGACRYVDVYVRKHADNGRVKCWLSVNNIRQYSYFGGRMTKRVWDAMGRAGLRKKMVGRDGTGEYDDWAATEKYVVERGIALVNCDRTDSKKAVLMDGDGEVLHELERWEFVQPERDDDSMPDGVGSITSAKYSEFDSENRASVMALREACELSWLSDNGYSGRFGRVAVKQFGAWMCSGEKGGKLDFVDVDDSAVRASMSKRWSGWSAVAPPLVGFS